MFLSKSFRHATTAAKHELFPLHSGHKHSTSQHWDHVIRRLRPSINMNVLGHWTPLRNLRADKHLRQLLCPRSVEIHVPLDIMHVRSVIDVDQTGDALECLEGLDVVEFVEVACYNDGGIGI